MKDLILKPHHVLGPTPPDLYHDLFVHSRKTSRTEDSENTDASSNAKNVFDKDLDGRVEGEWDAHVHDVEF